MARKAAPYNPQVIEKNVARRWERARAFIPTNKLRRGRKPFSVVIPPPNITGSLHMGHALNGVMQDVLVRYHRMRGDDTVWIPGTDHAGIATQNVVEKELKKEGKTRHDLGREAFVRRVWEWKEQYGRRITEQIRRLGCSCDWTRERFTLDELYVRAVQEAFIHYAQKGLIYRGDRIVNWCPRCASSISDLEVKYEEREGVLYEVKYPVTGNRQKATGNRELEAGGIRQEAGGNGVTVATTRPETMFGDVAVAVHPDDERYRSYVGQRVLIPLTDREIPVIADEAVDPAFGTGMVKVTPAHDHADADIAERHGLSAVNVIGEDGRMAEAAPAAYRGLTVEETRRKVLDDLRVKGLLTKETPHRHSVALCDRCGTTIQPLVSKQWFVRMKPLAEPALAVVKSGLVRFTPERWTRASLNWLQNVKDWCISRQLWWGHRLPVWYCTNKETGDRGQETGTEGRHVVFSIAKPRRCPECVSTDFEQDPDVLDTWFSSALWPFAVFGWPEATAELKRFYPTAVLTTAPEILHLWVARMIFSSLEFLDGKSYLPARQYGKRTLPRRVPFRDVIIHQTVLNLKGQRMSKSLGTGVDPMELIAQYGADATRFGLLIQTQRDQQTLRFDEQAVRTGRNFVNKLWNISRYLRGAGSRERGVGKKRSSPHVSHLTPFDSWILARLSATTKAVTAAIEEFRFGDAMRALHAFVWDDFADWYIEASKVPGMTTPAVANNAFATILQLLHPFLPFVSEVLWAVHQGDRNLLALSVWPVTPLARKKESAVADVLRVQVIVRSIRSAKTLLGIAPAQKVSVRVQGMPHVQEFSPLLAFLAGCKEIATKRDDNSAWVPLPAVRGVKVAFHRGALRGLNIPGRISAAEHRLAEARAQVDRLERQLEAMRGRATSEAVEDVKTRLAAQRALLKEQADSVAQLRSLTA